MVDEIRRKILKNTFLIGISSLVVVSTQAVDRDYKTQSNQNYGMLLARVFKEWMKQENIHPLEYIRQCGLSEFSSKKHIDSQSMNEFRLGNTFMIDGLILSKIEVAYLANVGSHGLV